MNETLISIRLQRGLAAILLGGGLCCVLWTSVKAQTAAKSDATNTAKSTAGKTAKAAAGSSTASKREATTGTERAQGMPAVPDPKQLGGEPDGVVQVANLIYA